MTIPQTKLAAARREVAKLEKQVARESAKRQRKLRQIPAKYGFNSAKDFIAAFTAATKGADLNSRGTKRTRSKITPETKAAVKKLVGEGKTSAQVASTLKISVPSVQNIKKELGLVRKKKKK